MSRPPRAALPAVAVSLLLAVALAGCGLASESGASIDPDAQAPTPAASQASSEPSAPPQPTASPESTPESIAIPTACLNLSDIDCQRAADLAKLALLPTDPMPIYIQTGPFGCRDGADRCAPTLDARPEGDVILEFADGTGVTIHLKDDRGAVQATRTDASGIAAEPNSQAGLPAGPQPLTLGHCGVFSGIDVDGSWWDPVGPVDMDSGDAVNATEGTFSATDPSHATFVAPSGFALQLIRRDGAKLLPFCM